ncbi:hypothetical protein [Metallosphaera hakonensis]|uniref:Uncharacterized protein n=1 Tax=Metallosphaera hakonensis JCM 8857 = DSM 7519 TaxID=1293036 RepID=A0A2U9IRY9_9CREN|nr:hypothetical protein [Metallosphaera hakonensis]AWR98723.1 hypothetical protein DFR87_02375 [Metallosphaera hakonensis JCM 8857 = DSM 7519]
MAKYAGVSLILISFPVFLSISFLHLNLAFSLLSSISFWFGLALLVFPGFSQGKYYWIAFGSYFLYHSILYSLVLGLLEPGGVRYLNTIGQVHFGYGFEVPPPPAFFPYWVSQSPAVWLIMGSYEADIVPYSVFMGVLLGNLMGLNVNSILELNGLRHTSGLGKTLIALPTIGVISGASCCLALPTIILYSVALSVPALSSSILLVLSSSSYFLFVYYGLPVLSALALAFNLRVISRAVESCRFKVEGGGARVGKIS